MCPKWPDSRRAGPRSGAPEPVLTSSGLPTWVATSLTPGPGRPLLTGMNAGADSNIEIGAELAATPGFPGLARRGPAGRSGEHRLGGPPRGDAQARDRPPGNPCMRGLDIDPDAVPRRRLGRSPVAFP